MTSFSVKIRNSPNDLRSEIFADFFSFIRACIFARNFRNNFLKIVEASPVSADSRAFLFVISLRKMLSDLTVSLIIVFDTLIFWQHRFIFVEFAIMRLRCEDSNISPWSWMPVRVKISLLWALESTPLAIFVLARSSGTEILRPCSVSDKKTVISRSTETRVIVLPAFVPSRLKMIFICLDSRFC